LKTRVWICLLLGFPLASLAQSPLTLHYDAPAKAWTEALPIGNGRLGAMVFGGVWRGRFWGNELRRRRLGSRAIE
jgi:alpha-L-fucosidase 2